MDYKYLIERLKAINLPSSKEAARVIETLLNDLDAAVEDLSRRPHHSACKHGEHCDYISAITGFPDCCSCDEWEWRGPQKEDKHEDD